MDESIAESPPQTEITPDVPPADVQTDGLSEEGVAANDLALSEAEAQGVVEEQDSREQAELLFEVHQQNYLDELLTQDKQRELLTDNYLKTLLQQGRLLVNDSDETQPDGSPLPAESEVDVANRQFVDFQGDLAKARQLALQMGLQVDDLKVLAEWGEKNRGKSLKQLSALSPEERDESTAALMTRLEGLPLEVQQQLMPRLADVPSPTVVAVGRLDAKDGSFVTTLQNEERVRLHLEYRVDAYQNYFAWRADALNQVDAAKKTGSEVDPKLQDIANTSFEEFLRTQIIPAGHDGEGQTWATYLYSTIESESKINAEVQYQADMNDNPITVFKKQIKRRRVRAGLPASDDDVDAEMQGQLEEAKNILEEAGDDPSKLDQAKRMFFQLLLAAAGMVGESVTTVSVGDLFSALFGLRQDYSSSYGYSSPEKMNANEALSKDRVLALLKNASPEEHAKFFTYYFGDSIANGGINEHTAKKLADELAEGRALSAEEITKLYEQLFQEVFKATKTNSEKFLERRAKLGVAFAKAYTRDNPVFFAREVWHDDAGVYATLAQGSQKSEFNEIVSKAT